MKTSDLKDSSEGESPEPRDQMDWKNIQECPKSAQLMDQRRQVPGTLGLGGLQDT